MTNKDVESDQVTSFVPENKTNYLTFYFIILKKWLIALVIIEVVFFLGESSLFSYDVHYIHMRFRLLVVFGILPIFRSNKINGISIFDNHGCLSLNYYRTPFPNESVTIKFDNLEFQFKSESELLLKRINGQSFFLSRQKDGFSIQQLKDIASLIEHEINKKA
ncbi:hypothetical protein [Flexithrix dorotheae]|uniref:hypothetical protein n=1 Tax=Flexithrix dorotheae TaxID=70993 RepID=UPI0003729DAE|nr:hypothetical protein [Flexithrix dorotheae]